MGIFRGPGGTGDATTDAIASQVSVDSATASLKATEAANSATQSATSAASSATSATNAGSSETNAATSASNSAGSATASANSATASASSATASSNSATSASTSETNAGNSATTAQTAQSAAVAAKTAAETAETNASTSAGTASTKAGEASTSAINALNSASLAGTRATSASNDAASAESSATSAASSLTSINAFYLGSASSNPTVDGNGNAVTAGDWYFNTSDNTTRIYTGSAWNTIEAVGATNVAAAGALMDSEVTNLAQVKAFDSSDYATSAQGTTADNALPKAGGAVTGAITTNSTFDGRDVATDGTKLDGIEALADVTDALNVTAAGALMDSEVTNLAQVKAFDSTDYATSAQGATADSAMQNLVEDTSPQLGGNLDLNSNNITGTGNITTTGTLQTSSNVIVGGDLTVNGTTTTVNTETINLADNNIVLNSNHTGAPSQNSGITVERGTSADKVFQWNETNDYWEADDNFHVGGNISLSGTVDGRDLVTDGTKLDNIEDSADVTDSTTVAAAGALMDSEVTNLSQVKAFDSSDYATSAQGTKADAALPKAGGAMTGAITTNSTFDGRDVATDGTKLDGIEALADVTDTTNVTAAGALMDSEVTNLAEVKAFSSADYATAGQGTTADAALPKAGGAMTGAITTNSTFDGRDVATDGTKLDGIEASADVTDTANVTAAGALMDSELTSIASVKALNQGVATTDSPTFATVTSSGGITAGDASTAAEITAHYNDGSTTKLQGFGLSFSRAASYVRPENDGTQTLYVGGSTDDLDWNQIHFRSLNGLYMTGTRFITTARVLQNITGITVDGNVKLDGNYPVGTDNVALGDTALDGANSLALRNVAIGSKALTALLSADDNIAIGYQAGQLTNTLDNIAIGSYALDGTDSGSGRNIAIGKYSMTANLTSGSFANTCLGYRTGNQLTSGNDNTLLGYEAGAALTTGSDNVAIGKNTLDNINTESFNTAVGAFALGVASSSVSSTAVGQNAGGLITSGSKNTLVGRYNGNQDGLDIRTLSNRIVISDGDANIGLYVDSSQDAHFNGNVIAYSTTISDRRLKSDITNISNALDKVGQINGVTFVRNHNGEKAAGIVAQEIMEVLPEAVKSQLLPLQTGEQEKEYYVVEYDAVTGLLVEAVKELKARVEALESK